MDASRSTNSFLFYSTIKFSFASRRCTFYCFGAQVVPKSACLQTKQEGGKAFSAPCRFGVLSLSIIILCAFWCCLFSSVVILIGWFTQDWRCNEAELIWAERSLVRVLLYTNVPDSEDSWGQGTVRLMSRHRCSHLPLPDLVNFSTKPQQLHLFWR